MARDDHFLDRIARLNPSQRSLALELFRSPAIIERALARTAHGRARRVAIELEPETLAPRLIIALDASNRSASSMHFVTCLGARMANGPWPVIDRATLDEARVDHWQRELDRCAPRAGAGWGATLADLEHSGSVDERLIVERVATLGASEPEVLDSLIDRERDRWHRCVDFLARRPEGYEPSSRVAIELWSAGWAITHLDRSRSILDGHDGSLRALGTEVGDHRDGAWSLFTKSPEVRVMLARARVEAAALRASRTQRRLENQRCRCGRARRWRTCCGRPALSLAG